MDHTRALSNQQNTKNNDNYEANWKKRTAKKLKEVTREYKFYL